MAGRTKTRAVLDRLTRRGRENEQTALEYVADYIASGGIATKLCDELETELGHPVSYGMLTKALKYENADATVSKALMEARRERAPVLVDKSMQIAEDVAEDKDAIAKAKLQIELNTWVAERADREQFGQTKAQGVQINIGSLHLDTLRRLQAPPARAIIEPTDAEVLSIEPAEVESIESLL